MLTTFVRRGRVKVESLRVETAGIMYPVIPLKSGLQ